MFERELQYLAAQEWACTGDDVLWRRSKLGLHLSPAERQAVEHWMQTLSHAPSAERLRFERNNLTV